jgi:hypothetical protein
MDINEDTIKNLLSKTKTPAIDPEFEDALAEILKEKNNALYEKKNKNGSFLLSWQTGLAFMSFLFLVTSVTLVLYSNDTKEKITSYLDNEVKSSLSTEAIIEIKTDNIEDIEIFIYDLIEQDKPPLEVSTVKKENTLEIYLFPGLYKIVAIKENFPPITKELHIKNTQQGQVVPFEINFESIDQNES